MKERLTNQEIKSREKKKKIYEVALDMFKDYGYEQTTIRDICKNAEVTTSTFYNFFKDKDEVLMQYYYEVLEKASSHLERTNENLARPYQSICSFIVDTCAFMDSYSKDIAKQVIFTMSKLLGGEYPSLDAGSEVAFIAGFLEAGKNHKTVSILTDSKKTAEYLVMAMDGITLYWLNHTKDESYKSVVERLLPLAFKAVTDSHISI